MLDHRCLKLRLVGHRLRRWVGDRAQVECWYPLVKRAGAFFGVVEHRGWHRAGRQDTRLRRVVRILIKLILIILVVIVVIVVLLPIPTHRSQPPFCLCRGRLQMLRDRPPRGNGSGSRVDRQRPLVIVFGGLRVLHIPLRRRRLDLRRLSPRVLISLADHGRHVEDRNGRRSQLLRHRHLGRQVLVPTKAQSNVPRASGRRQLTLKLGGERRLLRLRLLHRGLLQVVRMLLVGSHLLAQLLLPRSHLGHLRPEEGILLLEHRS
mmetsp:Transcript_77331/g.153541  ORF Transcript_77331/g.153541 Transcript_77331/m.153541 type:complete len:263 (+) Transcript_77331:132-920(+)